MTQGVGGGVFAIHSEGAAAPAATSTRMGNTFGTSVKPQRPAN